VSDSNLTEAQREQVARAKQAAEELSAEKSGISDVLMDTLVLETPLSERDVAALHAWQAQQSRRVAEAEAGHATCRAEAARLMDLLIEAQADGNHLRRALEWAAVRDRVGVRTALAATKEAQSV
jgi:hypothetical protein